MSAAPAGGRLGDKTRPGDGAASLRGGEVRTVQVILNHDVEKIGQRGDIVDVSRGYVRNFLVPRGLAEVATPSKLEEA
ncbi:MAG TPA: bL9 family ribosomal protein, partial [Rubrobacter sp.]|nr:bL9 family ribosomal protein [Rubrobacter sp.]